jgi:hypothetical protein
VNVPENLKVGDRFQIKYDPAADPLGHFAFLKTAWFEVVTIAPNKVEIKRAKS